MHLFFFTCFGEETGTDVFSPQIYFPDISRQSGRSHCSWNIASPVARPIGLACCTVSSHVTLASATWWLFRVSLWTKLCSYFAGTGRLRPYYQPYLLSVPSSVSANLPWSMFRWMVPVAILLRCHSGTLSRTPASSFQDHVQQILSFLQVIVFCWHNHPCALLPTSPVPALRKQRIPHPKKPFNRDSITSMFVCWSTSPSKYKDKRLATSSIFSCFATSCTLSSHAITSSSLRKGFYYSVAEFLTFVILAKSKISRSVEITCGFFKVI